MKTLKLALTKTLFLVPLVSASFLFSLSAEALDCSSAAAKKIKSEYPALVSCELIQEFDGDLSTWGGEYECGFTTPVGGIRLRRFDVFHKAGSCKNLEYR